MNTHMQETGKRVIAVFEGRDAAGKGGSISVLHEFLNPRTARNVALSKPSDVERGQWYFQRYIEHFPTTGELVSFDRSWYNRGGVEPVMGFCTPEQHRAFLHDTPEFEKMIVEEGIVFFKFWLNIGRETQLKRFHDRRHSPVKYWKLSGIDIIGMQKWDDYTAARDTMISTTHTAHAPWTVIRMNDKRRGRLEVLRHILSNVDYKGKDRDAIGSPTPRSSAPGRTHSTATDGYSTSSRTRTPESLIRAALVLDVGDDRQAAGAGRAGARGKLGTEQKLVVVLRDRETQPSAIAHAGKIAGYRHLRRRIVVGPGDDGKLGSASGQRLQGARRNIDDDGAVPVGRNDAGELAGGIAFDGGGGLADKRHGGRIGGLEQDDPAFVPACPGRQARRRRFAVRITCAREALVFPARAADWAPRCRARRRTGKRQS